MRDSHLPPPPEDDPEEDGPDLSPRHLKGIGPGALVVWALIGFAFGWSWHAVADALGEAYPTTWLQGVALWFLGAGLGGLAHFTRRQVRAPGATLDPERMVNRLVLARACMVVGAFVAGGYFGYALTWLGVHPDLVAGRVGRAVLAALGGLVVLVSGKCLELACRVPKSPPRP